MSDIEYFECKMLCGFNQAKELGIKYVLGEWGIKIQNGIWVLDKDILPRIWPTAIFLLNKPAIHKLQRQCLMDIVGIDRGAWFDAFDGGYARYCTGGDVKRHSFTYSDIITRRAYDIGVEVGQLAIKSGMI